MYLLRSMELFNFNFIIILNYLLLFYYFRQALQEGGERVKVCEENFF